MSVYTWLAVVVFAVAAAVDIFGVKLPLEWKQQRRRFWIIVWNDTVGGEHEYL